MSQKTFLTFLLSLLYFTLPIKTADKLRWSFELFLHGASTPNHLSEEYKDLFNHEWIGQNELTGVGLRQSFLVGYRDRLRYIEEKQLITSSYDPRDILVLSTETNRTIMSSYANIHGLFIPGTGPTIDSTLVDRAVPPVDNSSYINEKNLLDQDDYTALPGKMNIIPIHLSFPYEHFTNYESKEKCYGMGDVENKNKNRNEVKDFLKNLNEKYGQNLKKFFPNEKDNILEDYDFSLKLIDNIICLYMDGTDEFQNITNSLNVTSDELLKDCYDFMNYVLVGNNKQNNDFIPYLVSPLFDKLIKWMDLKKQKDESGDENYHGYDLPKYVILASDIETLNTFMSFMNLVFNSEIKYPYYATNLHIELFKEENNNYRLEYYYNDELLLSISYDKFKEEVNKNLKSGEEIDNFCHFTQNIEEEEDNSTLYLVGIIISSVIVVALIIGIIFMVNKRNNLLNLKDAKLEPIKNDSRESNEIENNY